jgi:hypothetical protein
MYTRAMRLLVDQVPPNSNRSSVKAIEFMCESTVTVPVGSPWWPEEHGE